MPSTDVWTSLEVVKLIVAASTPLALVLIAYYLNKRLKDLEQIQWANQKVVEIRIEFYTQVAPQLNDLLCFYTYVGDWKALKPPEIVKRKRDLDRVFHVNAPLFPDGVIESYFLFAGLCFQTFAGWGVDAKIRSHFVRRKQADEQGWEESWEDLFLPGTAVDLIEIQSAYSRLLVTLAESIGASANIASMPRGRVPRGSQIAIKQRELIANSSSSNNVDQSEGD